MEAPVQVGDEVTVKIEAVGAKGDGIAKVDGFVLFVAKTRQGDRVKVKITKVLKNVGFAEVVSKAAKQEAAPEAPEPEPVKEEPKYEDTETFGEE